VFHRCVSTRIPSGVATCTTALPARRVATRPAVHRVLTIAPDNTRDFRHLRADMEDLCQTPA
jgi:hypothetical protein